MTEDSSSKERVFRSQDVPRVPGVYVYRNSAGDVIYVGKARNLRNRMSSYFRASSIQRSDPRRRALMHSIASYEIFPVSTEQEALLLESQFIKQYNPRYNVELRDDKRYMNICIDCTEPFPRIELARIRREDGRIYFGPFPQAVALRTTVRFLEVRFGLRSCKVCNPDGTTHQHCLEHVIRDCSCPCIGNITPEEYHQRVEHVIAVLKGDCKDLVAELQEKMQLASEELRYEDAAGFRDIISNLKSILEPARRFVNQTISRRLQTDNQEGMKALQEVLGMDSLPAYMECFDMSNISGVLAVGSMVCFRNGRPSTSDYRRFRIRSEIARDDTAFMKEVLMRRYSRMLKEHQQIPDLIVLDGGAGQLRIGKEVMAELNFPPVKMIGLAERHEQIVFPEGEGEMLELSRTHPGLKLLQSIRDEAHRFANGYHNLLRNKRITNSMITDIPGIGSQRAKQLLTQFGSVRVIARMTPKELAEKADGVGLETASRIISYLTAHLDLE